jgi:lambda repressor-like predicted transcriptional regulator
MGQPRRSWAGGPEGPGPGFQLEDYILARMDLKGLSVRDLALISGIGRSRLHGGLHRKADKRIPLRMPEFVVILTALGIDPIEAMYAREIFDTVEGVEFGDLLKVISMVCGLMKGLPEEIITVIRHLDGLAFDDVRPEYGIAARGLLVRALTTEYTKIANRRVKRIDEFGQE